MIHSLDQIQRIIYLINLFGSRVWLQMLNAHVDVVVRGCVQFFRLERQEKKTAQFQCP